MKNKLMTMVAFLIVTLTFTACFGGSGEKTENNSGNANSGSFSIKYPDDLKEKFGEEVKLEKTPERVVVMTAGPVQTLYELGVKMVAIPDSVINDWSDDIGAKKLPFSMTEIDLEGVLALKPDFVILSTYNKEKYGKVLEENNIATYYVKAGPMVTFNDIKEEVKLLGEAFNKQEEMNKIMEKFDVTEKKMEEYKNSHEKEDMAILFGYPPSMTLTSTSYLGDILNKLGYNNLSDTNELSTMTGNSYVLNMEKLVSVNPKFLVATSPSVKESSALEKSFKEEFNKNSAMWNIIDAVKNNNVLYLSSSFSKSSGIKVIDDINTLLEKLNS